MYQQGLKVNERNHFWLYRDIENKPVKSEMYENLTANVFY